MKFVVFYGCFQFYTQQALASNGLLFRKSRYIVNATTNIYLVYICKFPIETKYIRM